MIDGEQKGPFELEELPAAGVRPSTYIWCKGLPDWQKAEDNPDVCRLFRNRLYDIMHPGDAIFKSPEEMEKYKVQPDSKEPKNYPSRFDYFLKDTDQSIPTLEEVDAMEDKGHEPISMIPYAWLVTIFCFIPTGIVALYYAYKSKKDWKAGNKEMAHDSSRSAKMWTGISIFIGLICYAFFFSFFL